MAMTMELPNDGREAELKFQKWLDENQIAYVSVHQGYDSFAKIFKGCVARPDFLVAVNYVGLIAFEVKEYTINKWNNFPVNKEKNKKIIQFKKLTNLPLWYVFIPPGDGEVFYVLQADKVETFECKSNAKNGDDFFCVSVDKCKKIQFTQGKAEIFAAIMDGSMDE